MGIDFSCGVWWDKFPRTYENPSSKELEGPIGALKLSDIEEVIPSLRIL
jgi:hypothetical protein